MHLNLINDNSEKPNVQFNTNKRIEADKNGDDKDEKGFYKLMKNVVHGLIVESFRKKN